MFVSPRFQIHMLKQCTIRWYLEVGALGSEWGHDGGTFTDGINVLFKRGPREPPSPLLCKHTGRRWPSGVPSPDHAGALTWDFPATRTCRISLCCYKLSRLCYPVVAQRDRHVLFCRVSVCFTRVSSCPYDTLYFGITRMETD